MTPLAQRYGAGSPDAAPPTPSSSPPLPGSPDLASGSPTGTRPAAHHFTIHPKVGIELDKSKHIVSRTQEMEDSTNSKTKETIYGGNSDGGNDTDVKNSNLLNNTDPMIINILVTLVTLVPRLLVTSDASFLCQYLLVNTARNVSSTIILNTR